MDGHTRKAVFDILEASREETRAGKAATLSLMFLILLNSVAVTLETVSSLAADYERVFRAFSILFGCVFTVEYALRIWACTADTRFRGPVTGRLRFALTPLAVVDLASILPFYLPMVVPPDWRLLRTLRLFRLFRLFTLGRYSESLRLLGSVFRARKEELLMMTFTVLVVLVLVSGIMYHVEHDAQPGAFASIPAAMWWGVMTITTVGYGDVYPVTPAGKVLAGMIAILGIGILALPAGIFASGLIEAVGSRRRTSRRTCPHCGRPVEGTAEDDRSGTP